MPHHFSYVLAFFSRKQRPLIYDGDLLNHEKILAWLTSQDIFELKNEIEEVNRRMLDKLLNENEFISVYFCKYFQFVIKPNMQFN